MNSQLTINGTGLTFSQMADAALSVGNAVDTRRPRCNLAAGLRQRPVLDRSSFARLTRPDSQLPFMAL